MWRKWLCAIGCGCGMAVNAAPQCEAGSGTQQMPLIELFTSEGCSSCPPADAWLARQDSSKAILLAWHVDYWNYLGWPDPLSQPAFSARQKQQAAHFGAEVYTPQFMLNGVPVAPGATPVAAPAGAAFSLQAQLTPSTGGWRLHLTGAPDQTALLVYRAVLVGAGETHAVRAGENAGRRLRHAHPVLGYWSLPDPAGDHFIPRPPNRRPVQLVVWAEQQQRIVQAVSVALANCASR